MTEAIREVCVAFSPEASKLGDAQQVKLSRKDRKRLAAGAEAARMRDAQVTTSPIAPAPMENQPTTDATLELDFDFSDDVAA